MAAASTGTCLPTREVDMLDEGGGGGGHKDAGKCERQARRGFVLKNGDGGGVNVAAAAAAGGGGERRRRKEQLKLMRRLFLSRAAIIQKTSEPLLCSNPQPIRCGAGGNPRNCCCCEAVSRVAVARE